MNAHIAVSVEGLGRELGFTSKDMTALGMSAKIEGGIIELAKNYMDQEYGYASQTDELGHSVDDVQIVSLTKSLSREILNFCEVVWIEGSNTDTQIVRQLADRASEYRWVKINLSTYCA